MLISEPTDSSSRVVTSLLRLVWQEDKALRPLGGRQESCLSLCHPASSCAKHLAWPRLCAGGDGKLRLTQLAQRKFALV